MITLVCQDGNNPYLNNPNATENAPRSQVGHKGRIYSKLSYEVKINALTRLMKIIQAIALTIFSCFIALAFQSIRNLWLGGIKGLEYVHVLMPQNLSVQDLLALRATQHFAIAELELVNQLNAG